MKPTPSKSDAAHRLVRRASTESSQLATSREALLNQRHQLKRVKPLAPSAAPAPSASTSAAPAPASAVAFSHLDFTSTETSKPLGQKRKGHSDPLKALSALNSRKTFLEKLTPQARERAEVKDKWTAVERKAEGTKVYDDEGKLAKAVKKRDKAKNKSRKAWSVSSLRPFYPLANVRFNDRADRGVSQEEQKAKRQAERAKNLAARKKATLGGKPGSCETTRIRRRSRVAFQAFQTVSGALAGAGKT